MFISIFPEFFLFGWVQLSSQISELQEGVQQRSFKSVVATPWKQSSIHSRTVCSLLPMSLPISSLNCSMFLLCLLLTNLLQKEPSLGRLSDSWVQKQSYRFGSLFRQTTRKDRIALILGEAALIHHINNLHCGLMVSVAIKRNRMDFISQTVIFHRPSYTSVFQTWATHSTVSILFTKWFLLSMVTASEVG